MKATLIRAAAAALACVSLTACTVHQAEVPAVSGPSNLAFSTRMEATPDSINLDGGSQSSIRVFMIGPDGKGVVGQTYRVDTAVGGVVQDFGSLSARTIVTGNDGSARVTFTAPAAPPNANIGTCSGLPGICVQIVATPVGPPATSNFVTVSPETVVVRLVPPGVILPPATTPTPCITVSPSSPAANTPVRFTAGSVVSGACSTATSDIAQFDWNFGDGSTGAGREITHAFTTSGTFVITLTETNDRGIAASTTQNLSVSAGSLPIPNFTSSPGAPAVNDQVFFNASGSTAGAGHTITSYVWDFGDGTGGGGVTTSHRYGSAGTFTVTLTVTDETGQSATTSKTVSVGSGNPTARLTLNKTGGLSVQADACSSTAAGSAQIVSYAFAFSDGFTTTTTSCSVTHAFTDGAGVKTVNVTVTDNASPARQGTASATVTVP